MRAQRYLKKIKMKLFYYFFQIFIFFNISYLFVCLKSLHKQTLCNNNRQYLNIMGVVILPLKITSDHKDI